MDGVVVVDKPAGMTSHDVVATIRRLLPRGTKVGHTGTLDPFATGVLPILIGKATRLARFLSSDDKRYLATVAFGHGTTTYDRTGEVTVPAAPEAVGALTAGTLTHALRAFEGVIHQTPPVYSAKKQDGVRAYERARRGDMTPPPAVDVVVHALALADWNAADKHATIDVHCGAGFYVRSLAHDLGVAVGVPAHLHALRRTSAGPVSAADAVPLSMLVEGSAGSLTDHVRGVSGLLTSMPSLAVTEAEGEAIRHGRTLSVSVERSTPALAAVPEGGRVRLLDGERLLALATRQAATSGEAVRLHPDIVLSS